MHSALSPPRDPRCNRLLDALAPAAYEAIAEHLEPVVLRLGDMLYEPGQMLRHAYFPTDAIVSLYYVTGSGASVESTGVGREGMIGMPLFMGGESTPSSAIVQTAGGAWRLERRRLQTAFAEASQLRDELLRYTQAMMTQIAQSAACYRHHSVVQQLSRWLLAAWERSPSHELVMTQELVAGMLGVRRESITEAAGKLQAAGLIRYRRGHISVLDAPGLEAYTCECYGVVKTEFQRLLPSPS